MRLCERLAYIFGMIETRANNFAFHVGRSVGRYKLESILGRGAMAEVYKSTHPDLGRDIAVKILHPFHTQVPGFIGRFRLEAQAAASLHHPNIVQVYDFAVTDDGLYYMVMQYINGLSLEEYLTLERAPLSLSKAFWFFRQIANALHFAHQRGTIHRDVKPANIMLDTRENAYLSDFGLAKIVGIDRQTLSGMSPGTPSYMAPEHISGKNITTAVDIYAMGVILYRMLTNRLPFEGDNLMTIITRTLTERPTPPHEYNPAIPESIEKIILKAMAEKPEDRYVDAATMARTLADAMMEIGETVLVQNAPTPVGVIPLPGLQLDNYKVKREFIRDSADMQHRHFQRYLAHNVALDNLAILTVLNTSANEESSFINRFQRRMDAVTLLDHPGLAAITRVDKTPSNQPYVAYEFVPGQSLETQFAEDHAVNKLQTIVDTLQFIRKTAEALAVAHASDIVHNDLRPSNIIVHEDGRPVWVGLEIPIAPDASVRSDAAKVLDYASPEQLEGRPIGKHSNIFSLGVILYEMLVGHQPLLDWDTLDETNLPKAIPLELAEPGLAVETYRLIEACLHRQEDVRIQNTESFVQRLDQAIESESALLDKSEPGVVWWRRRVYTAVPLTLLILLVFGFAYVRGQAGLNTTPPPTVTPVVDEASSGAATVVPVLAPTRIPPSSTPRSVATVVFSDTALDDAASPSPLPPETATSSPSATSELTQTPSITPTAVCTRPSGWITYLVKEGEALFNLALDSGATVEEVMQANCLSNVVLSIGQRLWLPTFPVTATPIITPSPSPTLRTSSPPPSVPTKTPPPQPTSTPLPLPTPTPLPPSPTP